MLKTNIFIVFSCFFSLVHQAQTPLADSLQNLVFKSKNATQQVDYQNDIIWELKEDFPKIARQKIPIVIAQAQKTNYLQGEAQAYNNLGVLENIHGNDSIAIVFFQKAIPLREKINDKKGLASIYNNIGNVYEDLGKYVEALDVYQKSLMIREELGDEEKAARVLYNIGIVHEAMGNYLEATNFVYKALESAEQKQDKPSIARCNTLLGNIKYELELYEQATFFYQKALNVHQNLADDYEIASDYLNLGNVKSDQLADIEALDFFQKALLIFQKLEDDSKISDCFNNIGIVEKHLKNYEKALIFFDKALKIRQKNDDQKGIMEVYNGMGDVKRRQQKLDEAFGFTQRYLAIATTIKDEKFIQKAYKDLSETYFEKGDFKKAYEFRKKYDEMRYLRLNEQRSKNFERSDALYADTKRKYQLETQAQQIKQDKIIRNSLIGGAIALFLVALLLYNRYRLKNKTANELSAKNDIIEAERKRSDNLLLNILPEKTAIELKENGFAKARRFENVSIMFTDFKSFTQVAEQLSPEDLVNELDTCFKAFDEIIGRYNIEKIKTIGDAYMCASGLPETNNRHAHDMILAAMEMQQFMLEYNKNKGENTFEMRIGINSGAVVAGVVGSKKFAFDIWGDSVNLAARMESAGEIGKINIAQATFDLVKNDFYCEPRGKLLAKNKGEVEMYFVKTLG